jgi:hypothetical protein
MLPRYFLSCEKPAKTEMIAENVVFLAVNYPNK